MISIVIPLYNKEKQIANTIQTVLSQTFQNFEIVIVNDGSTDNSVEEVEKIKDSRIRIINQQNAGVSVARNRGIEEAKYDLIAFLDADDEWKPEYLETQYNLFLKYPDCEVFVTKYEFADEKGNIKQAVIKRIPFLTEDGVLNNYFEVINYSNPPITSITIMVRKSAIVEIGGFLVGATLGEDLITWAKLAVKYRIAFSKKNVAIYNFRSSKQLVIPRRAPDKIDLVGIEFKKLLDISDDIFLRKYVALWHKMRMVTFVRLGMKNEANFEYKQIKQFVKPNKKIIFWKFLNSLPLSLSRFILYQIAKIRK